MKPTTKAPGDEGASMTDHWCKYCNGVNTHNCQFNSNLHYAIWNYDTRWGQAAQKKLRRFEHYGSRKAKSIIRKTTRKFPYISTVDLAAFTHSHMKEERAFKLNRRK